jgi:hypothetical protein
MHMLVGTLRYIRWTIALGDKANAWNVYVHDLAPEAWSTSSLMAMCSRFHSERRKMSRAC